MVNVFALSVRRRTWILLTMTRDRREATTTRPTCSETCHPAESVPHTELDRRAAGASVDVCRPRSAADRTLAHVARSYAVGVEPQQDSDVAFDERCVTQLPSNCAAVAGHGGRGARAAHACE